jgi:uncharacterized protein YegP (UPF0339 family)
MSTTPTISAAPARYQYDLDHNGEWRWIAIADNGETAAISPVGYKHLQDCLHAVGLMGDPGGFAVVASVPPGHPVDPPQRSLSRLERRLTGR